MLYVNLIKSRCERIAWPRPKWHPMIISGAFRELHFFRVFSYWIYCNKYQISVHNNKHRQKIVHNNWSNLLTWYNINFTLVDSLKIRLMIGWPCMRVPTRKQRSNQGLWGLQEAKRWRNKLNKRPICECTTTPECSKIQAISKINFTLEGVGEVL